MTFDDERFGRDKVSEAIYLPAQFSRSPFKYDNRNRFAELLRTRSALGKTQLLMVGYYSV